MKNNFILILSLTFCIALPSHSQIFKKKKKDMEDTTKEKTEKEIQKTFKGLFSGKVDTIDPKKENTQTHNEDEYLSKIMKGFTSSEPIDIEDHYQFDGNIKMRFTHRDKKEGQTQGLFQTFFSNSSSNFAYRFLEGNLQKEEGPMGTIIYDYPKQAMIILSENKGQKNGMVYKLNVNPEEWAGDFEESTPDKEEPPLSPYFKKTGKTQTIQGYRCEEYIAKDSSNISHFWFTKEIKGDLKKALKAINPSTYFHQKEWPYGFLMKMEARDMDSKEETILEVIEVNTNSKTDFSTKDYQLMHLGNFTPPDQEAE